MIDMRTVLFSYIISNGVCVIVMALLWRQNRERFNGLGFWLANFVMQFAAVSLIVLRSILPDFLDMVVSNALVIAGAILLLMGSERFVGKRGSHVHNYILLAVFILVHAYFVFAQPSMQVRDINLSLGIILVCSQGAWLMLHRVDAEKRSMTHGIGYIFWAYCLVAILRITADLIIKPGNDLFKSNAFDTLSVLMDQMLFVALTVGLYLMVNRRLVGDLERDISRRRQAEDALQLSEERFRRLVISAPDAIIVVDQEGTIILANAEATKLFGYEVEELLGKNVELLLPIRFQGTHALQRVEYIENPRMCPMGTGKDIFARRKDGIEFAAEISLSYLETGAGMLIAAFVRDITERKRMDDALHYRNNILAALHQVTLDLINRHEVDDILQTLLAKIVALLGASDISFDLVENNDTLVTYAVTSDQPLKVGDAMRRGEGGWLSWQAIESGKPVVLEDYSTWPKHRDIYEGLPIHAIMVVPIHHPERVIGSLNISRREVNKPFNDTDVYVAEQLAQIVAIILDNAQLYARLQRELAERIRKEAALHEAQAELVAQQRMVAALDERQRLGRDLHDSVNQSIHSLILFSETLLSTLEGNNIARARQIAERLQESARQALKETRLMLYEMQPSGPGGSVNLIPDLEARLAMVERNAGVKTQVIQEGSLDHCPRVWHENLLWITIEALNNALKHAQARNMQIVICCIPGHMDLKVIDDGIGFDPGKPRAGGFGLQNMRERAGLLGGELIVTSTPGEGSCICFSADIQGSQDRQSSHLNRSI